MLDKLCEKIIEIADTPEITYDDKYAIIFSDKYSKVFYATLKELNIRFEYLDPDSSYEEDVIAFRNALADNLERFTGILKYVKLTKVVQDSITEIL